MKRGAATLVMIALASCAQEQTELDLERFQSDRPEFGLTLGPDGYYLSRSDGPFASESRSQVWRYPLGGGEPEPASFSDPVASDSGFTWDPKSGRACIVRNLDIWCMLWDEEDGWTEPEDVGRPINTSGYEASPKFAPDGSLYFASMREGGNGQGDIYRAVPRGEGWSLERLGAAINSEHGEWNVAVSPDGRIMVFEASGRATNRTVSGDLYYSCFRDGKWQAARPMAALNTDGSDLEFSFIDDRAGYFTSATIGGDGVLRFAGAEHFAGCE